jgi:hypothetical protein
MNGAKPWRDSAGRGFEIPELDESARPAAASPTVRKREDRLAYMQALVDHSQDRVLTPEYVAEAERQRDLARASSADQDYLDAVAAHQQDRVVTLS